MDGFLTFSAEPNGFTNSEGSLCSDGDSESSDSEIFSLYAEGPRRMSFCDLAGEFRNNIYEHLRWSGIATRDVLAFASTCRQVRREFPPLCLQVGACRVDQVDEKLVRRVDAFVNEHSALQFSDWVFEIKLPGAGSLDLLRVRDFLRAVPKVNIVFICDDAARAWEVWRLNKLLGLIRGWKKMGSVMEVFLAYGEISAALGISEWVLELQCGGVGVEPWQCEKMLVRLGLCEWVPGVFGSVVRPVKIQVALWGGDIPLGSGHTW